MVWDKTVPPGTEAANNGDNRIRELKTDLETALRGDDLEGVEAMFPGADSSNPVFRYRGLKGATGARPAAGQFGMYFDSTRNVLQRDNGSSWDDIATAIPAGTVMVFYQSTPPVGWTQVITAHDKALRVVNDSSGGTTGGTKGFSETIGLAHGHSIPAHHHTIAHRHVTALFSIAGQLAYANGGSWSFGTTPVAATDIFNGAGSGGTGTFDGLNTGDPSNSNSGDTPLTADSALDNINLAYASVLIASKD